MKKVVLHIGTGKTGTSTIQNALHHSRNTLREKYGIDYCDIGLSKISHFDEAIHAHYPFADWVIENNHRALTKLCDYIKNSSYDTTVISCEKMYHYFKAKEIALLADLFSLFSVEIICYIRRPDLYVESAYKQQVKIGDFKMKIEELLERHTDPAHLNQVHANYHKKLSAWTVAFDIEQIKVRLFDKNYFVNGDLLDDFLSTIGIAEPSTFERTKNATNEAMPAQLIELIRFFNAARIVDKERHQDFVNHLKKRFDFDDYSLVDANYRRKILANYADVNEKLFAEFNINGGIEAFSCEGAAAAEEKRSVAKAKTSIAQLCAEMVYQQWLENNKYSKHYILRKAYFQVNDMLWLMKSVVRRKPENIELSQMGYSLLLFKLVFSGFFSPTFYARTNTDIGNSGINPFEHYIQHGWKEKRKPRADAKPPELLKISRTTPNKLTHPLLQHLREA